MHKRLYIETYGCQMNKSDSELIAGLFKASGYVLAGEPESADVILVNTCAVREHAEDRAFGRIASFKRYKQGNPDVVLGICGCMAQHLGRRILQRIPFVDLLVGPDAYRRLPEIVDQTRDDGPFFGLQLDKREHYVGIEPIRARDVNAWITVMRGCDKFCSFCIVPYVRGRERSIPAQEILTQVRALAAQGYKEITLLGQTVTSYNDGTMDFAHLLGAVSEVEGIKRVRFTAPHPVDFSEKLIRTMAAREEICNHIHLPIQSGSDRMLKAMRRGYTSGAYRRLVHRIREEIPGVSLTTDVMVGFPGEMEEDFRATYNMMQEVRYDSAFMFRYSPRKGTIASRRLEDDVPDGAKAERLQAIIDLQESISKEINRGLMGKTFEVLVVGKSRKGEGAFFGKTAQFKTTIFPQKAAVNTLVAVRVVDANAHTLFGELVQESAET